MAGGLFTSELSYPEFDYLHVILYTPLFILAHAKKNIFNATEHIGVGTGGASGAMTPPHF